MKFCLKLYWHIAFQGMVLIFELVYSQEAMLPVKVNLDATGLLNKIIYLLLCIMI
jgi:hypothetical protein